MACPELQNENNCSPGQSGKQNDNNTRLTENWFNFIDETMSKDNNRVLIGASESKVSRDTQNNKL